MNTNNIEDKMKNILFEEIYFQIKHKELPNKNRNNRDNELKTIYEQKTGTSFSIMTDGERKQLYEWLNNQIRYPLLNDLIKSEIQLLVDPYLMLKLSDEPKKDQFINNNLSSLLEIIRMQVADSIAILLQNKPTTQPSKITTKQREEIISQILLELDPSGKWLSIYCEAKEQGRIINLNECSSKEKEILCKKLELTEENLSENACVSKKTSPDTYLLLSLVGTTEDILTIIHEFGHYLFHYYNPTKDPTVTLKEFYPILFEFFANEHLKRWGISTEELFTISNARIENSAYLGKFYLVIYDYIDIYLTDGMIREESDIERQDLIINTNKNVLKKIFGDQAALFLSQTIAHYTCDSCIERIVTNPLEIRQSFSYILGHYLAERGIEKVIQDRQVLEKLKEYAEHILEIDPYEVFKLVGCNVDDLGLKPSIELTNIKNKEKSLGKKQ